MKIIVLGGGTSPERDVSLRSSAAVYKAVLEAGYECTQTDPADGLSTLDDAKDIIVFPILHGAEGEDGGVQKILESHKIPYLGSTSNVSHICFDKELTRNILQKAGIKVADGASVDRPSYDKHPLRSVPHVLKAQRGGSSIGTYIVRNPNIIDEAKVSEVFRLDNKAILEELVEGTEITIPVLGQQALPVIEIVPPEDGEFDYENKYNGKSQELCPSPSLSEGQRLEAQMLAEKVHKLLNCRHLSRIDMIMRANGEIVVLEANTIPGMTEQSLYPLSAKTAGISMPELMKLFIGMVKRDYNLK